MIRRSAVIATVALMLSLAVHFFAIEFTLPNANRAPADEPDTEVVSLGSTFEDIAEVPTTPVEPELAEEPTPPEAPEPEPEPEPEEPPTSQAQVASSNPQNVSAPDSGETRVPPPQASSPVAAEQSSTPVPDTNVSSRGAETEVSNARVKPPVDPTYTADAQQGTADTASQTSIPIVSAPAAPSSAQTPEPSVLAALPPEVQDPLPNVSVPTAETPPVDDVAEESAVSLRPQVRPEEFSSLPQGSTDETAGQKDAGQNAPPLIESPLTAYQRDGINVFGGRPSGSQSRGSGFGGSLGPGNATLTNYAGRVLMHLNRTRPVVVSGRGWARVIFRINPDGSLQSVDIIDGSGSAEIDRAARLQVRRGEPFPKPPGGGTRMLNFIYSIR